MAIIYYFETQVGQEIFSHGKICRLMLLITGAWYDWLMNNESSKTGMI